MTILIISGAHVGWCLQYAIVDATSQGAYFELLLCLQSIENLLISSDAELYRPYQ